jgi:soluble lytic murein transglycosylase-like protein
MRQLFVPACLCLMTWSSSTAPDPNFAFDHAGAKRADKPAQTAPAQPQARDDSQSRDAGQVQTAAVSDSPVDIPRQFDADALLMPRELPIPPPPLPKVPKPVVHRSAQEICDTLAEAAHSNDLPAPFFIRLIFQESRFKPEIVSSAGAEGIAQFMPETSADMGVANPFDPLQAIPASARLLRNLFQQFGNLGLAAAAYNAGPKRIQDWLAKKGPLPQETQGYVKTITGRPAENWVVAEAGSPELRLPRHAPCQEKAGLLAWDGPEQIPMPPTKLPEQAEPVSAAAKVAVKMRRAHKATTIAAVTDSVRTHTAEGKPARRHEALQFAARRHKHLRVSER